MAVTELMSRNNTQEQQLRELTECCICAESFTDPKMLPCMHTFCSGCLQEMADASAKRPGDRMPCPVCRREYQIPSDGFSGLPRNFLMDRLVEIATVSVASAKQSSSPGGGGGAVCDQCSRRNTVRCESSENKGETPSHPEATPPEPPALPPPPPPTLLYCVECGRKLCEKCCRKHRKKPDTKQHQLLEMGNQMTLDEVLQTAAAAAAAPRVCDRHAGKRLRTYCTDCCVVVCSACFLDRHRSHNGSTVAKVVDGFRSQLDRGLDALSTVAAGGREKKAQLENERSRFMKKMSAAEQRLVETTKELIDLIDAQSTSLRTQLANINRQYLSETQTLIEDLDRHAAEADGYLKHAADTKTNGSAADVCKAAGELNVRAKELTEAQGVLFARKPRPLQPAFRGTELLSVMRDKKMQFGIVEENVDYSGDSSLMCTVRPSASLPQKKPIWGVTVLGSEMFLVTDKDATVEAFDTTTFSSTRRWSIDGMNDPQDVRSCPRNSCLYVFNWKGASSMTKEIIRICPETRTVAKRWSTGADAGRLSVAYDTSVLLAVHNSNKLNEYASHGRLIAEVRLDFVPGCNHPWHAVKLSRDQYVVGYGDVDDRNHGICIVDAKGLVLRSFGGRRGGGKTLDAVDVPMNIGVDSKGSVFVADHNNGRVMVLNAALQAPRVLISKAQGLRKPIRVALDEGTGRLYVADIDFDFETRKWQEGEVLVIRIK